MKDRQFMVMLALVVAAGLVMGLIAFRVTGAPRAVAASTPTANATAPATGTVASEPDAAQSAPPEEHLDTADADSGEPRMPKSEPPELKDPPASSDATVAAAPPPDQSSVSPPPSGDSVQ